VDWVCSCIENMQNNSYASIEAEIEAENEWVDHVNAIAGETLYPSCNSWYLGANVPGKARVFMPYVGGLPMYTEKCEQVVRDGYAGFALKNQTETV
jgi:cyclohexanone monooxygenase